MASQLWDASSPATAVAGPAFGRLDAEVALRGQPAGTFVARVSLSQPGSLIVSYRPPARDPNAGADGLAHVALPAALLRTRRAEGWLRALGGATHALDAYTGRRVDKRRLLGGACAAVTAPAAPDAQAPPAALQAAAAPAAPVSPMLA